MSSTPAKARTSGIPGPSRVTGIPTPGRSRSSSGAINTQPPDDVDYMSRALADAIKANDPAQHQSTGSSSSKLSPPSLSGRRSAIGRSVSSASTASSISAGYSRERAKTPVSARPLSRSSSRQSDVFSKPKPRAFDIGDSVRIESLGFEGTLRYLGEIEGKPGQWAGVELSGGFAGKGKNNGTVNGRQYFSCPDKCGVFVSSLKLSAPTVSSTGSSPAILPPSLGTRAEYATPAASRGQATSASLFGSHTSRADGRITPSASTSTSGRITPSLSTSSAGRITPGLTPSSRRGQNLTKSLSHSESPFLGDKITVGSRAAKYMGMTAKQLSSQARQSVPQSPSRRSLGSASPIRPNSVNSRSMESPTLPPASPFSTPKLGLSSRPSIGKGMPSPNKGRTSLNTPRPRVPSSVAMPPPASPMSARSASLDHRSSRSVDTDFGPFSADSPSFSSSRPPSATARRSLVEADSTLLEQLQSRIQALEYDNERLRNLGETTEASKDDEGKEEAVNAIIKERDDAMNNIGKLQASLEALESRLKTHQAESASSASTYEQAVAKLQSENELVGQSKVSLEQKLADQSQLIAELEAKSKHHETTSQDAEVQIKAKEAELSALSSRLQAFTTDFSNERAELLAQVDELRLAGQETIALYEERLNAADNQRYELESRISSLEVGIAANPNTSQDPPPSLMQGGTSAAEIDNENLREQVLHLQRQISNLEDQLEDAQATSVREEDALRERMQRLREKEETMKQELNDGKREAERMSKSEARALSRLEESEEALRESTVALENARAEVEGLRSELANLDSLVVNRNGGDLYSRVAELAERATKDQARYQAEVEQLQSALTMARNGTASSEELPLLREENRKLRNSVSDYDERVAALTEQLEEKTHELESMRKRGNREVPIHNGIDMTKPPHSPTTPTRAEFSVNRSEITGLKHIVQELQKENNSLSQRIKLLEAENQLLKSEADQLRQEVQLLEDNLDKSLAEAEAEGGKPITDGEPTEDSSRKLKEQRSQYEIERDQLQKRLAEAEIKSARTIHDLNKEISELEALIESKIYREDELEQEVEKLKDKLARHKRSKGSTDTIDARLTSKSTASDAIVCEICERPGHDIFNCDVLNKPDKITTTSTTTAMITPLQATGNLFCEDCESYGHRASECPHSLDVF